LKTPCVFNTQGVFCFYKMLSQKRIRICGKLFQNDGKIHSFSAKLP